jgi:hypothetical protein
MMVFSLVRVAPIKIAIDVPPTRAQKRVVSAARAANCSTAQ